MIKRSKPGGTSHLLNSILVSNWCLDALDRMSPPSDGLLDDESLIEWFDFFNQKGLELLDFLLKRKQNKMRLLEKQIMEIKQKM